MRLRIDASIPGLEQLLGKLEPQGLLGALKNIGEQGVNLVAESFDKSADPYGQPWKKLSQQTLESIVPGTSRRRSSYGARPLVRMNNLRGSLNYQLTAQGVEIGVAPKYAKYHQGDDTGGKGIVPRRMFLPSAERGLPKRWQTELVAITEEYLNL